MRTDVNSRPLRDPRVWVRKTKGEIAVFNPWTDSVAFLNDTALAIWDLCDGKTRPDEMVDAICEISGLHETIVSEDVARTLDEFDRTGILQWREADDATEGPTGESPAT